MLRLSQPARLSTRALASVVAPGLRATTPLAVRARWTGCGLAPQHARAASTSATAAASSTPSPEGASTVQATAIPHQTAASVLARRDKPCVFASSSETLRECASRMREARVGAIMVKKDGKVAGIITDKDFVKTIHTKDDGIASCAEEVMTPVQKMAWVTPNTPLNECVVVMSDRRVRHLPVFTGNPADADTKLVGLVSIRDVLASVWGDKFGEKEEDEDDL